MFPRDAQSVVLDQLNPDIYQEKIKLFFEKLQDLRARGLLFKEEQTKFLCPEFTKFLTASEKEFLSLFPEEITYFLSFTSALCHRLRIIKIDDNEVDNLFKLAANIYEYFSQSNFTSEAERKKEVTSWFQLLDEFSKDMADVLGISIAVYTNPYQIIPSWVTEVSENKTLSLYAIDPLVGCQAKCAERAGRLGVNLKPTTGGCSTEGCAQESSSESGRVHIKLDSRSFPICMMYAQSPIVESFYNKFKQILKEKLLQNKIVILGYHAAGINLDVLIARVYNELIQEVPNIDGRLVLKIQGGPTKAIYYHAPQRIDLLVHQAIAEYAIVFPVPDKTINKSFLAGATSVNSYIIPHEAGIDPEEIVRQFPILSHNTKDFYAKLKEDLFEREKLPKIEADVCEKDAIPAFIHELFSSANSSCDPKPRP